jgi:hypothetical protein
MCRGLSEAPAPTAHRDKPKTIRKENNFDEVNFRMRVENLADAIVTMSHSTVIPETTSSLLMY